MAILEEAPLSPPRGVLPDEPENTEVFERQHKYLRASRELVAIQKYVASQKTQYSTAKKKAN